jgi:hypothetical protein
MKIVPKAGFDMFTGENHPIPAKESWNRNSYVSFGTILRINNFQIFKEASKNFLINFLFHKAAYKFQKNIHLVSQPLCVKPYYLFSYLSIH